MKMQTNTNATGNGAPSHVYFDEAMLPSASEISHEQYTRTFAESQFPSMTDAAITAKEAMQRFQGLTPEMIETTKAFKQSSEAITQAAASFTAMIDDLKRMLTTLPAVQPFLNKILDAITIIYDVVMAFLNKAFYFIPSLLVRLFQLFGIDTIVINEFVRRFISSQVLPQTVQEPVNLEAQGMSMYSIMTEAIGTLMTGHIPDQNQVKAVNDALRYKQGVKKEFTELAEFALWAIRSVPDQIQIWLSHVVPTKWWLELFAPGSKYYAWITEVNTLDTQSCVNRASFEHELQEQIKRLHRTGQELLKDCTVHRAGNAQIFRLLADTFKKLDTLFKIVDVSALNEGTRPVPFVIYLYGPTGQGKSFLMGIIPPILGECAPDTPNLSWSRNSAIQHWDGYTGQLAVKYDDFGAVAQTSVSPGEVSEIITIVSNEQMRLPMASLEEKGSVFRSRIVLLSSNIAYLRPTEVRDQNALHRRRHVFVEVRVKNEFRKPGKTEVDPARIPDDFSHWEFIERDNFDDAYRGRTLNYGEFIAMLKQKYREHFAQQDLATRNFERMVRMAREAHPIQLEGIFDDFTAHMNSAQQRIDAGGNPEKMFNAEVIAFLKGVQKEHEALKPSWYDPLMQVLPFFGFMAATLGVGYIAYKAMQAGAKKGSEAGLYGRHKLAKLFGMLKSDRAQKINMQAEGRWAPLYERIKNGTPEMVAIYENAMDNCPDFANLTDDEVIDVIERCLSDPKMKKHLIAEGVYSGHHYKTGNKATNKFAPRVWPPKAMTSEGCIDNAALDVTQNRILPHVASISVDGYDMMAFGIGGRCFLTTYHLWIDPFTGILQTKGKPIRLKVGTALFQTEFDPDCLVQIGQDTALYYFEANVPVYKETIKYFIKNEDIERMEEFPALMATLDRSGLPMVFRVSTTVKPNSRTFIYSTVKKREIDRISQGPEWYKTNNLDPKLDFFIKQRTAWVYGSDTAPGMCGSPLVQLDNFAARKVVGIHCAGTAGGESMAQIVTQEMIREGLKKFGMNLKPAEPAVDFKHSDMGLVQLQGNFTKIGTLIRHPRISDSSKIVPSLLHGKIFPVTTAPAVLNSRDPRAFMMRDTTPLRQGIEKYGKPAPMVDKPILRRVIECMKDIFRPLDGMVERRVLTQDEALNGIQHDEFINTMDMKTSAGFPWNQKPGAKGKFPYIQRDAEDAHWRIVDKDLQSKVDQRFAKAKVGERVESLWVDTLKDERRDLEKIYFGKTRVFTIPPVDYTIVARRLFGSFLSAFYHNRLKFFSAVGIDPGSLEWTIMYNKLQSNSDVGFAGDFSGWDGNLSPQFMMGIAEMINDWYSDGDSYATARNVLFDEIIHTYQCALNEVYQTHVGNPSGNALTVNINTIQQYMYFLYVWFKVAPPEYNSLQKFQENVVIFDYGDDGMLSIKATVLPFFNPEVVLVEFRKLNLEYTNAHKTGPAELIPVDKMTFLKRGFRDDGFGIKLATIELQTIAELLNWTRTCADISWEQASVDNINDSLHFMFSYGEHAFQQHREKIIKALPAIYHQQINDYLYYYKMFYNKSLDARIYPQATQAQGDVKQPIDSSAPISTSEGESIRESENTKGIILQRQREEEISGPTLEPKSTRKLAASCIGEPQWSLPDMVNRRTWVNTYTWSASQGVGSVVISLDLPKDVIVGYFQSAAFERFTYWRGSITLEFEITGMRQQMGRLKIFSVPFTRGLIADLWHSGHPETYYALNPLSLDPASSVPAKLVVPFVNPKGYITINGVSVDTDIDFIGCVKAVVLVPLGAAACATQSVDVVVWASFGQDSDFKVPQNSAAAGVNYNREHREQRERMRLRNLPIDMQAQGGVVSNQTTVTAYGNMDGTCIPQKLTADDFSGMASGNTVDVPAFDRAARTPNPINNVRKYIQNFSNSKGSEMVTRLDLDPSNMSYVYRDHFATNVDEMSMDLLQKTPTYVRSIPWPGATVKGTSLYSAFLGPMFSLFTPGTTTQIPLTPGALVKMTLWEFNSMRFRFWRGDIRIRLEIVATAFHVGKLLLTVNYGAPPGVATGLRDASSQYAVEIELNNEKGVFDYQVEWLSPTIWKEVCKGPSSPDDVEVGGAWWNSYFMGSFDISVINQLQTVCNSPPDAVIILSVSGGDNFQSYMPWNGNATFAPSMIEQLPVPTQAQGVKETSKKSSDPAETAGTDAKPTPPDAPATVVPPVKIEVPKARPTVKEDHFGQSATISDARWWLRRYYPIYSVSDYVYNTQVPVNTVGNDALGGYTPLFNTASVPVDTPQWYCIYDVIPVQLLSGFTNQTYGMNNSWVEKYTQPLQHLALQYRMWRGSLRYKVIFGNVKTLDGVDATPANSGVSFIPVGQFSRDETAKVANRPNWAFIASQLAQAYFRGSGTGGGDSLDSIEYVTGNAYAADFAGHGIVNYCEVEVPFSTIYNTLPTPQAILAGEASPGLLSPGTLIVFTIFSLPYTATLPKKQVTRPLTVLRSVGDDFRFGNFLGMPNIYVTQEISASSKTLWPDSWTMTAPVKIKIESEEKKSDDEFEQIEPERMTKSVLIKKLLKAQNTQAQGNYLGSWRYEPSVEEFLKDDREPIFMDEMTFANESFENTCFDITSAEREMVDELYPTLVKKLNTQAKTVCMIVAWLRKDHLLKITTTCLSRSNWVSKMNLRWELPFCGLKGDVPFNYTQDHVMQYRSQKMNWSTVDEDLMRSIYRSLKMHTTTFRSEMEQFVQELKRHQRSRLEFLEYPVNTQAQGSLTGIEAVAPTTVNLIAIITTVWQKYNDQEMFTARSAINEIEQRILTTKYVIHTDCFGPAHSPTFRSRAEFTVDNPIFSNLTEIGMGPRKKASEEEASAKILTKLYDLIPTKGGDVVREQREDNPIIQFVFGPHFEEPEIMVPTDEDYKFIAEHEPAFMNAAFDLGGILANSTSETFFTTESYVRFKELINVFGYRIRIKLSTHRQEHICLMQVKIKLVTASTGAFKPSITQRYFKNIDVRRGDYKMQVIEWLLDGIKSTSWYMLNKYDEGTLKEFSTIVTNLE